MLEVARAYMHESMRVTTTWARRAAHHGRGATPRHTAAAENHGGHTTRHEYVRVRMAAPADLGGGAAALLLLVRRACCRVNCLLASELPHF